MLGGSRSEPAREIVAGAAASSKSTSNRALGGSTRATPGCEPARRVLLRISRRGLPGCAPNNIMRRSARDSRGAERNAGSRKLCANAAASNASSAACVVGVGARCKQSERLRLARCSFLQRCGRPATASRKCSGVCAYVAQHGEGLLSGHSKWWCVPFRLSALPRARATRVQRCAVGQDGRKSSAFGSVNRDSDER